MTTTKDITAILNVKNEHGNYKRICSLEIYITKEHVEKGYIRLLKES